MYHHQECNATTCHIYNIRSTTMVVRTEKQHSEYGFEYFTLVASTIPQDWADKHRHPRTGKVMYRLIPKRSEGTQTELSVSDSLVVAVTHRGEAHYPESEAVRTHPRQPQKRSVGSQTDQ